MRRDSLNRRVYDALVSLAPERIELFEIRIGRLPHYNEDLEQSPPPEVLEFRDQVRSADGILFISPEYNHSLPGVVKNAIDWGSRPFPEPALWGKPGAFLGAAVGRSGTMRAQLALRQILPVCNVQLMTKPDVYLTFAEERFDENGGLIDPATIEQLQEFIVGFEEWIRLIRAGAGVAAG